MASSPHAQSLPALAERIRRARRLTILTGAGVSAASGVPTFRGAHGLWRTLRAEALATPEAFARDPVLVWEWYAWRRELVARCAPNEAHHAIARWSNRAPAPGYPHTMVITQNVDDLHVRAGTANLTRLHGSLWELKCAAGEAYKPRRHGDTEGQIVPKPLRASVPPWPETQREARRPARAGCSATWRDDSVPFADFPPHCRNCGGMARPAIVWFGEPLDRDDLTAADSACFCDVFLAVGTSAVVYPAAGLVQQARRHGAFTVEINVAATAASAAVDLVIEGAAEHVLPALEQL
jgi:NAD+-dependent protein deacetylase sirtuin 5